MPIHMDLSTRDTLTDRIKSIKPHQVIVARFFGGTWTRFRYSSTLLWTLLVTAVRRLMRWGFLHLEVYMLISICILPQLCEAASFGVYFGRQVFRMFLQGL